MSYAPGYAAGAPGFPAVASGWYPTAAAQTSTGYGYPVMATNYAPAPYAATPYTTAAATAAAAAAATPYTAAMQPAYYAQYAQYPYAAPSYATANAYPTADPSSAAASAQQAWYQHHMAAMYGQTQQPQQSAFSVPTGTAPVAHAYATASAAPEAPSTPPPPGDDDALPAAAPGSALPAPAASVLTAAAAPAAAQPAAAVTKTAEPAACAPATSAAAAQQVSCGPQPSAPSCAQPAATTAPGSAAHPLSGSAASTGARPVPPSRPKPGFAVKSQMGPLATMQRAALAVPLPAERAAAPAASRAQGDAPTPALPPRAAPAPTKNPPAFGKWVERAFLLCRNEAQRQHMMARLARKIKECEATGCMWAVDWASEPLPSIPGPGAGPPRRSVSAAAGRPAGKRERSQEPPPCSAGDAKRPAWDDAEEDAKLQARAGRFGTGCAGGVTAGSDGADAGDGNACGAGSSGQHPSASDSDEASEEMDFSCVNIRGVCRDVEKSYFRLTDAPDPSTVRPEVVLVQSLQRLVGRLQRREASYFYALDQFKGMRQDCTVQHLRNGLAVQVYEAHARCALEHGDSAEFHQCQTQLHAMYAEGALGCRPEFVAYKLLYQTVHARRGLNKALLATMQLVASDPQLSQAPEVGHALQVRGAVMTADNLLFFRLYASAPNLGRALLDSLALKVRWTALTVVLRAYKSSTGHQNLPLPFVSKLLGFGSPSSASSGSGGAVAPPAEPLPGCSEAVHAGRAAPAGCEAEAWQACLDWLTACNVPLVATGNGPGAAEVDTKVEPKLSLPAALQVSHGDPKLSLDDFRAASRAS